MTFEAEQSSRTPSNHGMDSMESFETEYDIITDSYCDVMDSQVMCLYCWGTDGILLTPL